MSAQTIDVDSTVLRRRAAAALHSARQMQAHVDAEVTNEIDIVMGTLAPKEPYAYTLQPQLNPDGSLRRQPIAHTWQEVRKGYEVIHAKAILTGLTPITEIHGDWYSFVEGAGGGIQKATGEEGEADSLILFPTGRGEGITGELFWNRHRPFAADPAPGFGAPVTGGRRACLGTHDQFIASLRAADVSMLEKLTDDGAQTAVRDYVDDTGTLIALDGKVALREFYERFFAKYEVMAIEKLCRVVDDWYAFAELRWTTRLRSGPDAGAEAVFNTAEYCVFSPDARILVRIGHGTDLDVA
jgi:hypothetical protein